MKRLFISYSSKARPFADALIQSLSNTWAIESPLDISPDGRSVVDAVRDAVQAADAVAIVMDEDTQTNRWQLFEYGLAIGLGKPVVMVVRHTLGSRFSSVSPDASRIDAHEMTPDEIARSIETALAHREVA